MILPFSRQAFSTERIKIVEMEQLPNRFNFNLNMIRNLNQRLPLFAEEARHAMPPLSQKIEKVMEIPMGAPDMARVKRFNRCSATTSACVMKIGGSGPGPSPQAGEIGCPEPHSPMALLGRQWQKLLEFLFPPETAKWLAFFRIGMLVHHLAAGY